MGYADVNKKNVPPVDISKEKAMRNRKQIPYSIHGKDKNAGKLPNKNKIQTAELKT